MSDLLPLVVGDSRFASALSHPFFGWEGFSTKIDYRKSGYPYSSLSTGGPRFSGSFRI